MVRFRLFPYSSVYVYRQIRLGRLTQTAGPVFFAPQRVRHSMKTAFRSWTLYTEQRHEEQARVAQVQAASNRYRQRASLAAWREALQLKRREAAMDEAARLLRQRSLLRKGVRGLIRQRK